MPGGGGLPPAVVRPRVTTGLAGPRPTRDPAPLAARRPVRLIPAISLALLFALCLLLSSVLRRHHLRLIRRRQHPELLLLLLAHEHRSHPAEDVVHNRLCHRYLAILRAAGRLEAHVRELV